MQQQEPQCCTGSSCRPDAVQTDTTSAAATASLRCPHIARAESQLLSKNSTCAARLSCERSGRVSSWALATGRHDCSYAINRPQVKCSVQILLSSDVLTSSTMAMHLLYNAHCLCKACRKAAPIIITDKYFTHDTCAALLSAVSTTTSQVLQQTWPSAQSRLALLSH